MPAGGLELDSRNLWTTRLYAARRLQCPAAAQFQLQRWFGTWAVSGNIRGENRGESENCRQEYDGEQADEPCRSEYHGHARIFGCTFYLNAYRQSDRRDL